MTSSRQLTPPRPSSASDGPSSAAGLVLMTTGGTIGTAHDYTTRLTGAELLALLPGARPAADVTVDDADARPSTCLTPREMLALAHRAVDHLAKPEVGGIVVTFGTDAMDEFTYLLQLAVQSPKPVIVTGAMHHSKSAFADGPRNLYHALLAARAPQSRDRGTMMVIHGAIHSAREVVKVSTTATPAFASPRSGPLGWIEGDRVLFTRKEAILDHLPSPELEPNVDLIVAAPGTDNRHIEASLGAGARGLVIAAMGGGSVTDCMYGRLLDLAATGFPIVLASRCIQGSVIGRAGNMRGMLPSGDLAPHKARIKLMMALGIARRLPPDQVRTTLNRCFPAIR